MTDFKPNLFGRICFVVICSGIYFLNQWIISVIRTGWFLIDVLIYFGLVIGSCILVAKGIWKILNSYK